MRQKAAAVLATLPVIALASAIACGSSNPPPQPPPKIASAQPPPPPPPAPPPPPKARWVETGSFNAVGPSTKDGTLLLLGGRRALLAADGTVKPSTARTPEPIEELAEVPTPSGPRLVGRGERTVYRFDDPLGEPKAIARSARNYTQLGAGPGVAALWTSASAAPTFVNVDTGAETPLANLPVPPVQAIAFASAKDGAAIFAAVGLAVTTDGGATWKPVTDAGGGALSARGLYLQAGELRTREGYGGGSRKIDFATATLEPIAHPTAPANDAPAMCKWLTRTHRDPLEAAITSGVVGENNRALVVADGLVARVDLASGAISDLVDLSTDDQKMSECQIARSGTTAWVACTARTSSGQTVAVRSLSLTAPSLAVDESLGFTASSTLRASPSGGLLLLGRCKATGDGNACVRQPSGKWQTVEAPQERAYGGGAVYAYYGEEQVAFGTGPLADGGVAYLTHYRDENDDDDAGAPAAYYGYGHGPSPKLRFVVIEGSGMHRKMPAIDVPDASGQLFVLSNIEEDDKRNLHVLLQDEKGPVAIVQTPSGPPAVQRLEGATAARMRNGRAVAVGEKRLFASQDGGSTWAELLTPPHVFASVTSITAYSPPTVLAIGDAGIRLAGHLRIGWGDLEAMDVPEPKDDDAAPPPPPPPAPTEQILRCTSDGATASASPTQSTQQLDALFGITPAPAGTRRNVIRWSQGGDAASSLSLEIDDDVVENKPEQRTWRVHWYDGSEIGGRARSSTIAAPKGISSSYTYMRSAAASGDRLAAVVQNGSTSFLLRTKAAGGVELVPIPDDLAATSGTPIAIGPKANDPIVWRRDAAVVAVQSDGAIDVIASLPNDPRAPIYLGVPTQAGVPILAATNDWGILRVAPLPKRSKKEETSGARGTVLPAVLDGWVKVPPIPRLVRTFTSCTPKSSGSTIRLNASMSQAEVDAIAHRGSYGGQYALRVAADTACVASFAGSFYAYFNRSPPLPASPPPSTGPVDFLRADLVGARAEGGLRGAPPIHPRKLKCALGPK